jgi:predicted DCC family thiol-disulfide oxidoreductase YuxK
METQEHPVILFDGVCNLCNAAVQFVIARDPKQHFRFASTGALKTTKGLSGGWPLLYALIIVPKFIRDAVYNFIAKNRYRWFGKQESCWVPTPALKSLFLD